MSYPASSTFDSFPRSRDCVSIHKGTQSAYNVSFQVHDSARNQLMTDRRYQTCLDRQQQMLLPPSIDDYVSENNMVRAIDTYVETLDLEALGFSKTSKKVQSGQPAYSPYALLKLYLYGYIQHIRSSRRLERETVRNLEVIWLLSGLKPVFKTIANFRKENSKALRAVNRDFVMLCDELKLVGKNKFAVDGTFLKANASKSTIYTQDKLNKQVASLDRKIREYQDQIDEQDKTEDRSAHEMEDKDLKKKLQQIKDKQAEKKALKKKLDDSEETQISTVDPDARLMSKRGSCDARYNAQIVTDDLHKLIVASDVTQEGNDYHQLEPMVKATQKILRLEQFSILADSGYYEGRQLKACEDIQVVAYVAVMDRTKQAKERGETTRYQFKYDQNNNCYTCPEGKTLTPCGTPHEKNGKVYQRYSTTSSICNQCPIRSKCLGAKTKYKQLSRWEHEDVLERHSERMAENQNKMSERAAMVEHPFGTIKYRAGKYNLLMRGLDKCRGEFSLMVLSYNFTRVLNILGLSELQAFLARRGKTSTMSPA